MAYYVYIDPDCQQVATKHGKERRLELLKQEIEQSQNISRLEKYMHPYLHENIGRIGRLLIESHERLNETVLCFKKYCTHKEYDDLLNLTTTARETYYNEHKTTSDVIDDFLQRTKIKHVRTYDDLSHSEIGYLKMTPVKQNDHTDDLVVETELWCSRIKESWARPLLSDYATAILNIYYKIERDLLSRHNEINTESYARGTVSYCYYSELSSLLLIAPINPRNSGDQSQVERRFTDRIAGVKNLNDLRRLSIRAYPSLITYDPELWVETQENDRANLALSTEETEVLESVTNRTQQAARYPLFINGRAGSGKSTILQYLFAEQLRTYRSSLSQTSDSHPDPPLYLTYSKSLLNIARTVVRQVLTASSRQLIEDLKEEDEWESLDTSFQTVRTLFLGFLPKFIRPRFAESRLMQFHQFRQLWDEHRDRYPKHESLRKLQPALVWHAIRTYIKGMQIHSPDEYTALPEHQKSISQDNFEVIFHKAWNWYEKICEEEGYWDDQDLAEFLLDRISDDEINISRYPAVFCDEAQDFTQIEIKLIQELMLFSKRNISKQSYLIRNIPFAFAGDPMQTLNPTGFNWSSMQSMYYKNILQRLAPQATAAEFNYQELALNYRSVPGIVKFANVIQLFRRLFLGHKELKPQKTWAHYSPERPIAYEIGNKICQNGIRDSPELPIIVPCEENGEDDYTQSDAYLSSLTAKGEEGDGSASRILSPMRAKGLEYDRVLLYRFGDFVKDNQHLASLRDQITNLENPLPSRENLLLWEYFLNNLYVAISRARKRLIIVDSKESLEEFWQISSQSKQAQLLNLGNLSGWSSDDLGGFETGSSFSWSEDRDDPLLIAQQYETHGRENFDVAALRSASYYYRLGGDEEKKLYNEAMALEFDSKFAEAAEVYAELRCFRDGCRCYWAQGMWDKIVDIQRRFPEIGGDKLYQAATLLTATSRDIGEEWVERVLDGLIAHNEIRSRPDSIEYPSEEIGYSSFMPNLIDRVLARLDQSTTSSQKEWRGVAKKISATYPRLGLSRTENDSKLPELFYRCGDPEQALSLWNERSSQKSRPLGAVPEWVARAEAAMKSSPGQIRVLGSLGDHAAIVNAWKSASPEDFDAETQRLVVLSALKIGEAKVANRILPKMSDLDEFLKATELDAEELGDEMIESISVSVLAGLLRSLDAAGRWDDMIGICEIRLLRDERIRKLWDRHRWIHPERISAVLYTLARSDHLVEADEYSKRKLVDRLVRRYLVVQHRKAGTTGGKQSNNSRLVKQVYRRANLPEIGGVIERVFAPEDSCQFYDTMLDKDGINRRLLPLSKGDILFAKKRWLACARSWAEQWPSDRGVNQVERELLRRERAWRLSAGAQPRFPELGKTSSSRPVPPSIKANDSLSSEESSRDAGNMTPHEGLELANEVGQGKAGSVDIHRLFLVSGTISFEVKGLELEATLHSQKRRIVVIGRRTQDQIRCGPVDVRSEDVTVSEMVMEGKGLEGGRQWQVEEWGICCTVNEDNDSLSVRVFSSDGELIFGHIFPGGRKGGRR